MQSLAEKVMRRHMSALQQAFEKSYGRKAPWLTDRSLVDRVAKNSEAYRRLLEKGLTEQQAWDSLKLKREMTLVNWDGEFTKTASSFDSLVHYMKFLNTGSVSIDPNSGAVKTWIGGIDFDHYKYDHVSQSRRQVGSTFKPIVYTAALEAGIGPCTHFSAQEIEYNNLEGWSPGNSSEKNETYLNYSMQEALSRSVNTVSVKVLEQAGIPAVITTAKKMGIRSPLPELPSLALGTGEIRLKELVGAYASYVNHGRPVTPYLIQAITDNQGEVLHKQMETTPADPAFSEHNRLLMLELMKSVVNQGTASRLRSKYGLKNHIAGKTGTTQNNKDAWFVAITPRLIHGSWVGLDHHEIGFKDTSLGQGASAALPLFALLMQELNRRPEFSPITTARFETPGEEVLNALDCKPVVRDNFFKRLFKNPKKTKSKKFKDKTIP
jgi:penicillin-binding protein 1A